jgi:hypothetical protein
MLEVQNMKTHVEFRSDKFPPYEGEEEQINTDHWGRRLGEYLKEKLSIKGIETGELGPEDWGWCLPVENESFSIWIGFGHYQEYPNGYLCFVEPSKSFVWKLFKKIDTTHQVNRVVKALDEILTSDPAITDIRWWDEVEK